MRKIPSLFTRDPSNPRRLTRVVDPRCQWVLDGEGTATRKYDGTCVMVRDGRMYARRAVAAGKTPPAGFELVEQDPVTGKAFGWVPVGDGPEWARHREAFEVLAAGRGLRRQRSQAEMLADPCPSSDGTYELCGPGVNGNPERLHEHLLIPHGYLAAVEQDEWAGSPRTVEGIIEFLGRHPEAEGIVWWRTPWDLGADVAKLKRRDVIGRNR